MISEQDLLIARLKDTATEELRLDMEKEMGDLYDIYYREFNTRLVEFFSYYHKYFSTTEMLKVYWQLAKNHNGFDAFTNADQLRSIDIYLNINRYSDMGLHIAKWRSKHQIPKNIQGHPNYRSPGISRLLQQLKAENDKRKMRRLKRKEAKLKKKGVRLFDSNEQL